MATLKQVAEMAGVSIKTVSRVVNESPDVAPKTREHVERIIAEMNYHPNVLARSLASGKSNTIGLLIHHSVEETFKYPYFSELLGGISSCLDENKLDLVLRFMGPGSSYVELYDQQRVDGLIIANAPLNNPDIFDLVERKIPCVFLSQISLNDNPSHFVDSDFRNGARIAAEHLLALGHRHFAFMPGPQELALAHFRTDGFKQALEKYGVTIHEDYVLSTDLFLKPDIIRHYLTTYWLQRSPVPTAFITSDDLVAVTLTRELQQFGYNVPQDFSVIGWDNTMLSTIATPQITSIGQQTRLKGYTAVNTLLNLFNRETDSPVHQLLDMELQIRESTGPVAIRR